VGLIRGQHHRAVGEVADLLLQVGHDLVAVGVASRDQAGPPPVGDLAHAPVQGPQRYGWAARSVPQPWDGPGAGLGQQPQDPLAQPPAAQAGPA
jgi:hypothetical protein